MSEAQHIEVLAGDDAGIVLLRDIRNMFDRRGVDRMASVEIVEALGKREDRPWSKWKDDKPMTPRQLARLLEPFAVSPTTIWAAGKATKGYLTASFARYAPAKIPHPTDRDLRNPQKSANPNGLTDEKPVSVESTPATPMVWLQTSDRRWLGIAARWFSEKGTPLRATVSVHGAGAFIPAHWLAGGRP
jgi:hypothetical protein